MMARLSIWWCCSSASSTQQIQPAQKATTLQCIPACVPHRSWGCILVNANAFCYMPLASRPRLVCTRHQDLQWQICELHAFCAKALQGHLGATHQCNAHACWEDATRGVILVMMVWPIWGTKSHRLHASLLPSVHRAMCAYALSSTSKSWTAATLDQLGISASSRSVCFGWELYTWQSWNPINKSCYGIRMHAVGGTSGKRMYYYH